MKSISLSTHLTTSQPMTITENLLRGLMESFGWHDIRAGIAEAERSQQVIEQELSLAVTYYLEEPNIAHRDRLIAALIVMQGSLQREYDDAIKQQQKHAEQIKIEIAKKSIATDNYLSASAWGQWMLEGAKNFFGSTSEQQIEKYKEIAETRHASLEQLSLCLQQVQTSIDESEKLIVFNLPEVNVVDSSEDVIELDTNQVIKIPPPTINFFNKKVLSVDIPLTQFPAVMQLADLNGKNGFKIDGEISGDESGYSVSTAGDINGDGFADLFIGAPSHNKGDGRSYVVFGGFNEELILLTDLNGTNGFKLDGTNENGWSDESGYSVSIAGDINEDGIGDLFIGGISNYSYVVFGGSNVGNTGTISLSNLNGGDGFKLLHIYNYLPSVSVSTAGDVNGDNYADLIIGFSYCSLPIESYVVFGGASVGSSGMISLSTLNGSNGFKIVGESYVQSYCGTISVSTAGDINGDNFADLLIGDPVYNEQAGRSYVVFGGYNLGNTGTILLSSLTGRNGFYLDGETISDSGFSVSTAGDVNGDGYSDLLIGSPGSWGEHAYVIFGGSNVGSGGDVPLSDLNGRNGFKVEDDPEYNYGLGYSVSAVGDMNGDNYPDLLIGASASYYGGYSYLLFGHPGIGSTGVIYLPSLTSDNGFQLMGEAPNDCAGCSVSAAGDVNGDGLEDLLIGAYGHNNKAGRTYVVFGQPYIPDQQSSSNNFLISLIAGVAGGVIGVGILIGCCYHFWKKKTHHRPLTDPLLSTPSSAINSQSLKQSVTSERSSAQTMANSMKAIFGSSRRHDAPVTPENTKSCCLL